MCNRTILAIGSVALLPLSGSQYRPAAVLEPSVQYTDMVTAALNVDVLVNYKGFYSEGSRQEENLGHL